jgi:hypothetical protein
MPFVLITPEQRDKFVDAIGNADLKIKDALPLMETHNQLKAAPTTVLDVRMDDQQNGTPPAAKPETPKGDLVKDRKARAKNRKPGVASKP